MSYQYRSKRASQLLAARRRGKDRLLCWVILGAAALANLAVAWYFWPQVAALW